MSSKQISLFMVYLMEVVPVTIKIISGLKGRLCHMKNNLKLLLKITPYLNGARGWSLIRITTACLAVINSLLVALIMQKVTDSVLLDQGKGYEGIVGLFISTAVSTVLTNYFMNLSSGKLSAEVGYNLQQQLSDHLQKISIEEKEKWEAGEYISRFTNDLEVMRQFLSQIVPQVIFLVFMLIGVFGYLAFLNGILFSFVIITVLLLAIMSIKLGRPLGKFNERLNEINDGINNISIKSIEGARIAKHFQLYRVLLSDYYFKLKESLSEQQNIIKTQSFLNGFNHLLYFLPTMGGVIIGGFLSIQGKVSPGQVISFIYIMHFFLINAIEDLLGQAGSLRAAASSMKRIIELNEKPCESQGNIQSLPINNLSPLLIFENVSYDISKRRILTKVNLALEAKKKYALVGLSGSGKTTVVNIIGGFITSFQGSIKLFGANLRDWDPDFARRQIAVVSQDSYLFPGSIYENICYGNMNATEEDIYYAAKLSYASEFIEQLPEQYETIVGERGTNLSGGQIQRLSIARAFLKNAPLLILDEPTSSLDPIAQVKVSQALEALMQDKTVLIISHEFSAIRNADEIMVMHEGSIIARGRHAELLNDEAIYRKFYEASCLA